MKQREKYFLGESKIDHDGEIFDYIRELHQYLWRFVRTVEPVASGYLDDFIDDAIDKAEAAAEALRKAQGE